MAKKRGTWGAYQRNFPRSVQWMVDQDYVADLSDEERQWLADFNDRHYGADFRGDEAGEWDTETRRQTYRDKNLANVDAYTRAHYGDYLKDVEDIHNLEDPERDVGPSPAYLSSPEYKAALKAYRETLSPGRKPVAPKATPKHTKARRRLTKITNGAKTIEERKPRPTNRPDDGDRDP
jgi:hypothetical protein